jgi:hypothetical protein
MRKGIYYILGRGDLDYLAFISWIGEVGLGKIGVDGNWSKKTT